jgi:hypothetical protein
MSLEKKIFNGVVLTAMLSSSLQACSPTENPDTSDGDNQNPKNGENIPQEQEQPASEGELEFVIDQGRSPLVPEEYYDEDDTSEELVAEITQEEVEELEREFDYSVLDIYSWNNFEVDTVERQEPGYVVEVVNPTSLYVIPITDDEFLDQNREVEEIVLSEGINLEVAEIRNLKGQNGEEITVGLLANTFGAKAVTALVLGAKDSYGTEEKFVKRNESGHSSVTYVNLAENIYPNKVYNTYYALLNISKFQDQNGMFEANREYSYLDLIGLLDGSQKYNYLVGLMSSGREAWAGGVCAMATGISLLVHQNSENRILEQWHHPQRYFQGPFSMSPFEVDATVQMVEGDRNYDFRWILSQGKYLKIDADMTLSGVNYSDTSLNGIGGLSDVNVIYSMSFTDEYPEGQTERLMQQMESYAKLRDSQHNDSFDSNEHAKYEIADIDEAIHLIYDREDLRLFSDRIRENEALRDIIDFGEAVNSYVEDPEVRLSDYLKTTDWYRNYLNNPNRSQETLDYAMRILSHQIRIEGQPLQCVSYSIILAILYPDFGMQPLGGSGVASASELIREENVGIEGIGSTGFGGLVIASRDLGIERYQAGDHFVVQSRSFGHVGTIIDAFEYEGERYLLVSDSNRFSDGRVRFFVVNAHSLDFVFGHNHRYIIRSASNHTASLSE